MCAPSRDNYTNDEYQAGESVNLITDTSFRHTTLAALAQERASSQPDDTALLFDSGVRLSFAEAWQQALSLIHI